VYSISSKNTDETNMLTITI